MFTSSSSSQRRRASHGATPTHSAGRNEFRSSHAKTSSRDFLSPEDALRRPRTQSATYTHSRKRTVSFSPHAEIMPARGHATPAAPPPRYPTYMTRAPHVPQAQPAPVQVVRVPFPVPVPVERYRHSVQHVPAPLPATSAMYSGGHERRPMIRRSSSWAHLRRDEPAVHGHRYEYDRSRRYGTVGVPFAR